MRASRVWSVGRVWDDICVEAGFGVAGMVVVLLGLEASVFVETGVFCRSGLWREERITL